MLKVLLVAVGGAVGALARFGVGELALMFAPERLYLGTLTANVLGCLAFGALHATSEFTGWGTPETRALIFTGMLGAFTTFSTFEADTFNLWTQGQRLIAAAYVGGSVILGLLAFMLGWFVAAKIHG